MFRRPRFRAATLAVALACTACAGGPAASPDPAPPGRRANDVLAAEWRLYLTDAPEWPAARARWLAGPPAERALLLDNLLRELIADDAAGRGSGTSRRSARARHELTWFGPEAIEALVDGLRALGSRPRVDGVVLDRIATGLADLRATGQLAALAAPDAQPPLAGPARLAALRGLARIEEDEACAALIARLQDDPSWEVRGAAADALRRRREVPSAVAALRAALADPDGYVRAQAVRALADGRSLDVDDVPIGDLFAHLQSDRDPQVRAAAAETVALYSFDARVEAALVGALRDPAVDVMLAAARALATIRTRAVQLALVDALERVHGASRSDLGAAGAWNELRSVLGANLGEWARGNTPAAWRALIEQRWRGG